jgi:hypothetical protein
VSNAALSCDKRQVARATSLLVLDFGQELGHVHRPSVTARVEVDSITRRKNI